MAKMEKKNDHIYVTKKLWVNNNNKKISWGQTDRLSCKKNKHLQKKKKKFEVQILSSQILG